MRRRRRQSSALPILITLLALAGAFAFVARAMMSSGPGVVPIPGVVPSATPTPSRPDPRQAAQQYFELWNQGQYEQMYGMVSEASRSVITQDRFVSRYRNIATGVGITSVAVELSSSQPGVSGSEVETTTLKLPYRTTLETGRFGRFGEDNELRLVLEAGRWRVDWAPSLVFKGLTNDNSVRVSPDDPIRGSILDRKGRPLATLGKVLDIGVVAGRIKDEAKVLAALSGYLGMKPEVIKAKYANANPDWWIPLQQLPLDRREEAKSKLGDISGIGVREKDARVYPASAAGAHVVGYISQVNAEDLKRLRLKGYDETDVIGRAGVEAGMEETLAGEKGGSLAIVGQNGSVIRTIVERKAKPGANVQLTIDVDVQRMAEEAIGDKTGSIVVIDPRDHSILAMASHPSYNPNSFILGLSDADWKKLSEDKRLPFQNRATLSAYPTGSVFKVVTMAAGLEKGGFRPESQFSSPGEWTLPGTKQVFRDWIPQGHGQLNLIDGLSQSANPVFYEIGHKLNSIDPNVLPGFARDFGLGAATGIVGLPEASGTLPSPEWKRRVKGEAWYPGDAVNLAIGQGYLEATPLQVANYYAALADGGNMRSPLLVKRVGDGPGAKEYIGEGRPKLPASASTLGAIREGMKRAAADPRGTANYAFKGFRIPTAAKTGSAENQSPDAHAWFAGYAPADNPEVVVVVMVEGGRAGGEVAAPLGRRFLESYFAGR